LDRPEALVPDENRGMESNAMNSRRKLWLPIATVGLLLGPWSLGQSLAEDSVFSDLAVAETGELDTLRAQNGNTNITVQSNQDLTATVTGSTFNVDTIYGGSVTIGEGALENFSGVGLFNIVTGNNNAVNSAVGVTFNLQ
jgi:hypothetical protein